MIYIKQQIIIKAIIKELLFPPKIIKAIIYTPIAAVKYLLELAVLVHIK